MELTLNLIWVAVSTAMFIAFLRGARPWRFAATVAICLAAIAFPIISITDDLGNDVVFADASAIRRSTHRAQLRPFAIETDVSQPHTVTIEVTCCGFVAVRPPLLPAHRSIAVIAVRGPPLPVC